MGEVRSRLRRPAPVPISAARGSRPASGPPKVTLTVSLLLKTASGRTLLDDLSEIVTLEMEGEALGVRPAAAGTGTGNDTPSEENEMTQLEPLSKRGCTGSLRFCPIFCDERLAGYPFIGDQQIFDRGTQLVIAAASRGVDAHRRRDGLPHFRAAPQQPAL